MMDDDDVSTEPIYSIQIMSPVALDKKVGDAIHIRVNFDEASMETLHHVNVQIYEKGKPANVIYSGPSIAHVHEESGHYELHADVSLDEDAGVVEHTDWILKARVWGHDAGVAETADSIAFHVHPM